MKDIFYLKLNFWGVEILKACSLRCGIRVFHFNAKRPRCKFQTSRSQTSRKEPTKWMVHRLQVTRLVSRDVHIVDNFGKET